MGILDLAALAEEGVALVKEQNAAGVFGLLEYSPEIFFCFADVFADDLGDVDFVQLHVELLGNDLRTHGFSGAGRSGKQNGKAAAIADFLFKSPAIIDLMLMQNMGAGALEQILLRVGQNHIIPGVGSGNPTGEITQLVNSLTVTTAMDQLAGNSRITVQTSKAHSLFAGANNLPRPETKGGGQLLRRPVLSVSGRFQGAVKKLITLLLRQRRQFDFHLKTAGERVNR